MYKHRMNKNRIFAAILVASAAIAVYGRGNRTDMIVTLRFTPQEGVTSTTVDLSPALLRQSIAIRVQDARQLPDPLVIGHGTGEIDKSNPDTPVDPLRRRREQQSRRLGVHQRREARVRAEGRSGENAGGRQRIGWNTPIRQGSQRRELQ